MGIYLESRDELNKYQIIFQILKIRFWNLFPIWLVFFSIFLSSKKLIS